MKFGACGKVTNEQHRSIAIPKGGLEQALLSATKQDILKRLGLYGKWKL